MRKNKRILAAVAGFVAFSVVFSGIVLANSFDTKAEQAKHFKFNYKHAVFERDNNLYLFDDETDSLSPLGGDSRGKVMPSLNSGTKQVAFAYSEQPQLGESLSLGIVDLSSNAVEEMTIPSAYSNAIVGIDWINDQTIGVEGHVNPATSEYFIVDVASKQILKRYVGSLFTPLPNGSIIYRGQIPLGQEDQVQDSYFIDDTLVYTSEQAIGTLEYPQFSKDMKHVVFMETSDNGNKIKKGDIDLAAKTVAVTETVDVPEGAVGNLVFDGTDSSPSIVDGNSKLTIDSASKKLVKQGRSVDIDLQQETKIKLDSLNQKIKETFHDESEKALMNVQYLQWYP
ncbi:hypothetical protein [Gorillibacterium sp. sgz500922]|uniref:hypothetical protein n=1 Tax=Gorillibacterium sp. sgz500922 TaxID=3446694 RepID=UPI003F66955B